MFLPVSFDILYQTCSDPCCFDHSKRKIDLQFGTAAIPAVNERLSLSSPDRVSDLFMTFKSIFLLLLQITPIVVLLLSLTHPHLVTPIFIVLIILFPFLLFKFFQQASEDFEREIYSRNQPKTEFKIWDGIPFSFEESIETPPPNPLDPYLQTLKLSYPYTIEQLNRAYRQRARETHPDLPGGNQTEFIRVYEAYEALKQALQSQGK